MTMEYNSILEMIEDQKRDSNLSAKVFRYTGLIKAIEFFSQKLNFEQIIEAAFDFTNELLTLQKSAIFIRQGSNFVLKKLKGYGSDIILIKSSSELEEIAVYHGNLLHDPLQLSKYFNDNIRDAFGITMVIPLIIESSLYGFIFISSKVAGNLDSDDYIISEALMKLFNNALENYNRYEELQKMNKELDEKIFNLFAINQSSKALLSELNLDVLYNLSVDVFSELTQSSATGFVLFDDKIDRYILKSYKDVFNKDSDVEVNLTLNNTARIDLNRIILNTSDEKDVSYFNSVFNGGIDNLNQLKARYIILLLKSSKVLGFVTLGPTMINTEYKASVFELTESMASATYIALSNAQLFKCVNEQKRIIEERLEKLISLNKLTKNINSSLSSSTLMEITLKTLEVSYNVDKALIALYSREENEFIIEKMLNINSKRKKIKINSFWKKVMEGDSVFEASENGLERYIDRWLIKETGDTSGILIVPVYLDKIDIEVLGVIIIFKYKNGNIDYEENKLIMETVAGHIAPILSNLSMVEEQKRLLKPNYIETFKSDLKKEISDAEDYKIPLEVVYVEAKNTGVIFEENILVKKLRKAFKKVYPFSNERIFILFNEEGCHDKEIRKLKVPGEISIRVLRKGADFDSYEQFFKCFL